MRATFRRLIGPLIALILFSAALWTLRHELKQHHLAEILGDLATIPSAKIFLAALLTAFGYLVLTLYDAIALTYVQRPVRYAKLAFASFLAYTFSHNIGFGLLTGGSIRYRFYSAEGLSAGDVTRVVGFAALSLGLGYAMVTGVALLVHPLAAPQLPAPLSVLARPAGGVLILIVCAYLAWSVLHRGAIAIRGWQIPVPPPRLAVAQIAIASLDWAIAATVLYVLLPDVPGLSYIAVLSAFMLAAGLGIVSHVPAGLGVFETTFLVLLPPDTPAPGILGALIAYRVIYYLLPLGMAAILLAVHELQFRTAAVREAAGAAGRWVSLLAPQFYAGGAFVAGAILLASGAMPSAAGRLDVLGASVPLPVIEISHFLGSLAGVGLLLLARGLQQRLDAAFLLTVALLAAGILLSLLKGLDYEEAAILAVLLAGLLPARRAFYRRASVLEQRFTLRWIAAIAIVVTGSFWLGFFASKHVHYATELWWSFALDEHAPRFLRASVGVVSILLMVAVARLLRPAPPEIGLPGAEELEQAACVAARSPATSAWLALLGDKSLLFSASRNAFLMYGVAGRSWMSVGDPVGPEAEWPELAWHFREISHRHGGWTVFYEVSAANLPLYLDLGLALLKIGEEASVPLDGFSLEGGGRKELRYIHRKLLKEGCRFEILQPSAIADALPRLQGISDAWLREKKVREKGFSLGRFDPAYLRRFPIALVRQGDAIVAFANLWPSDTKEELSIDLMRYLPTAPRSVMDFLFVEIMLWGKAEGYRSFGLGMVPLSGLEDRALAPAWSRFGAYLFRHGEHFYNFQGLRHYKEKFDPVWEPRYLAAPGGLALPLILANTASLIAGGFKGLIGK